MKNKNIWLIALVFILGLIFRLLFLDKAGGLSYDELVSFKQASQSNALSTIYYTLKTDVHMPLYQLFLHWWAKIFSLSDLSLRAFSAFCGILTIITGFYTGRELPPPEQVFYVLHYLQLIVSSSIIHKKCACILF